MGNPQKDNFHNFVFDIDIMVSFGLFKGKSIDLNANPYTRPHIWKIIIQKWKTF